MITYAMQIGDTSASVFCLCSALVQLSLFITLTTFTAPLHSCHERKTPRLINLCYYLQYLIGISPVVL